FDYVANGVSARSDGVASTNGWRSLLAPPVRDGREHRDARPARNGRAAEPTDADESLPPFARDDQSTDQDASNSLSFLRRTTNARTRMFRRRHFPDATTREWNDWRWQSRHRIRSLAQLDQMLRLSDDEREALVRGGTMLPVGISPYYM